MTRAISLASGIPYPEIRKKLFHTAKLLGCTRYCVCCYRFLIEDVLGYKPVKTNYLYASDFLDKNPNGAYLLRMDGHIATGIDNTLYDIFDSRFYGNLTDAWKID